MYKTFEVKQLTQDTPRDISSRVYICVLLQPVLQQGFAVSILIIGLRASRQPRSPGSTRVLPAYGSLGLATSVYVGAGPSLSPSRTPARSQSHARSAFLQSACKNTVYRSLIELHKADSFGPHTLPYRCYCTYCGITVYTENVLYLL